MRPLDGVTVVAIEQAVAAPLATRHLADLGARVIKVERPGAGDFAREYDETVRGMSSHFVWLNRSKESIAIDLKSEEGLVAVQRLVSKADVFVQNLAPSAAERLGLGAEQLRRDHPTLVHCSISGYGSGGPYTDKKAYDLLVQCEAGLLSITGTPDDPAKVGVSIADIAAGVYTYTGVLAALLRRERTQEGATIEVSMLEALAEWTGFPMYYALYGGTPPPRTGASHAAIAPYGPFICGDRKQVFMGIQNQREWATFCRKVLHRPDLAEDARYSSNSLRVLHREQLNADIASAFQRLASHEVIQRLDEAGIANARLRDMLELVDHPQLAARERWTEVESPVGTLRALLPPAMLDCEPPLMGEIPRLGQHTESILAEIGMSQAH